MEFRCKKKRLNTKLLLELVVDDDKGDGELGVY